MRVHLFIAALLSAAAAWGGALPMEADFAKPETSGNWEQSKSGYYQPLGKVEQSADGLRLASNDKTVIIVGSKERFPIHSGDQIELTLDYSCAKDTYVYLGLYEYKNGAWVKNDIAEFWVKPDQASATRTITVKPGKEVNFGAVVFGIGTKAELTVKKVSAKFKGMDAAQSAKADLPAGLVLHLDGSRRGSMELADGKIVLWRDLSGKGNDVRAAKPDSAPALLENGVNRLPMVRFDGKQELGSAPLSLPAGVTVFVLFRREAAQTGGESWQDALYWGDGKAPDNTGRNHLTLGASAAEEFPRIVRNASDAAVSAPMRIGSNAGMRGFVKGDIGEILVFDRPALSAGEIARVSDYLLQKWNFSEDDFVRFGPLPAGPKRVSDALPLSDQENKGAWKLVEAMSDEFSGNAIDRSKWTDQVFYTLGPAPVRTLPDNVSLKDGMAQIVTKYDPAMPSGRLQPRGPEYHSFSNGMLQSVFLLRYGYIEARTKIQPTSFNNAFWMIGGGEEFGTGRRAVPEIDIYELAGKSFAHTYTYNMALHYVQHKPEYKHHAFAGNWKSNFKFTDDFHVYGLEWTPKVIRYYIDGVKVREFKVKHNYWDLPMTVHFNSLPHFDWFGIPDPKDFPSTYYIDYLRVWKNPETDLPDDWKERYKLTHLTKTEGYAYDYYRKNGDRIVPEKTQTSPAEAVSLNLTESAEAAAKWEPQFGAAAKFEGNGTQFTFPAVGARKDNGEVQYAAPSAQWPRLTIPATNLSLTDWAPYEYMTLEFDNPNRGVESCTIHVALENGQTLQQPVLMKSGQGVFYWKLPEPVRKNKIKSVSIGVRGSDRAVTVKLTAIKLEK